MSMLEWLNAGADLFQTGFGVWEALDNRNYSRQQQQTQYDREDNAVQRRVADLQSAGLSPTLAAGSAAGAGSVVNGTSNMSKALNKLDAVNAYINTKTNMINQQQAQTQADILREQLEYDKEMNKIKIASSGYDALMKEMDFNYLDASGLAPYQARRGAEDRLYDGIYNLGRGLLKSLLGIDINDPDLGTTVTSPSFWSTVGDNYHRYDTIHKSTSGGTHSGRSGSF